MIVKKVRIKNFRNIEDLKIDFTSNSNGSKINIERGIFINDDKGKIISKVNALIGANAIGKTNILYAIFFWDFVNKNLINKNAFINQIKNESEDKLNLTPWKINELANQKIIELLSNQINKEDFEKFLKYKNEEIRRLYSLEVKQKNKPIIIELTFWNKKLKKEIFSKIEMTHNDITLNPLSYNNKNFSVFKYNESEFFYNELLANDNIDLEENVDDNLLSLIGEKDFIDLINVADPNIKKIFIDNKSKKIFYMIKDCDNNITFNSLSSGTKKFLYIFKCIFLLREKEGIILIDELELNMHRELVIALIDLMNMIVKKNKNLSFIFTTHNPMILNNNSINYKQIFDIRKDINDDKIIAQKLSYLFKSDISCESKYKKGMISSFPASSYVWDVLYDLLNR